ncbi:MAG: hypothetical protein OEL89_04880, partial [Candidatus Peregrinibacteria bacterium]|nr:hypothetical protein [Candidatus Peregrinibacteria bacterium]
LKIKMKKLLLVPALAFQVFSCGLVFAQRYEIDLAEPIGDTEKITADNGIDLLVQYIALLYSYGAALIGVLCVFIIVISGVQIIFGGVAAEGVTQAKTRIFQAIFSLILLFGSALLLTTINPGFFKTFQAGIL